MPDVRSTKSFPPGVSARLTARRSARNTVRPSARVWLLVPLLLLAVAAAMRAGAPARAQDGVVLLDGFEVDPWPDPGLWRVPGEGGMWPSDCRARSGRRALRAFGGGPDRGGACDAPVPAGTTSAARLRLDLRAAAEAHRLDLYFEIWARMPAGEDAGLFLWLLVPRESGVERVPIFGATGAGGDWTYPPRRLDLRNLVDVRDPSIVYDLRGGRWDIEWVARAPDGAPAGHGFYVDDLSLVWEPAPAFPSPTPYVPPTSTVTATRVPPSATPSPTVEPTPTALPTEPPAPALYLPLAFRTWPEPTATATPGAETPTPGGPTTPPGATATPDRTATPDATTTPTPAAVLYLPRAETGPEPQTQTPTVPATRSTPVSVTPTTTPASAPASPPPPRTATALPTRAPPLGTPARPSP